MSNTDIKFDKKGKPYIMIVPLDDFSQYYKELETLKKELNKKYQVRHYVDLKNI